MREILAIRFKWQIIIITLVIVGAALIPIFKIEVNPDLESYFPSTMESKANNDEIKRVFGITEPIVIILECNDVINDTTIKRIGDLSKEFKQMSQFTNVVSLTEMKNIRGDNGLVLVEHLVKFPPADISQQEELRKKIYNNNLVYGLIVSKNFKYTIIILSPGESETDSNIIDLINRTLKKFPGKEKLYLTGLPYLRNEANNKISRDISLLLPFGLMLMFLFLWISFKEIKGVLLPFLVVICSIIISLGLVPLFNWKISIIGILIPIMMIAIANNYGVHFISKYQEENAIDPDATMRTIVSRCSIYLMRPIILCGITTILGVMGLLAHVLSPARQMGVVTSIGIGFALVMSLTFIPAVMSTLKKGIVHKNFKKRGDGSISLILTKVSKIIVKSPIRIIIFFVLLLSVSTIGLIWLQIAPDSNNILPPGHPYNKSINIAENNLGGSKTIFIMVEGDMIDPYALKKIEHFESELKQTKGVGSVTSIVTLLKEISKAINNPLDSLYNNIPSTREGVSQYLELYNMGGSPEELERFIDFDNRKALITIQYKAKKISDINIISDKIDTFTLNETNITKGGYSLVEKEMNKCVATGQYYSLIVAFVAIFFILTIIFKSFSAGIMGSIPLIYAVLSTFGLMGLLGIELNIVTALISSISIGLGVDFTIHLFWRIKQELRTNIEYKEAIISAITKTGRGITINALSVITGFSILFFSSFPLIRTFAFLIILSLTLCLICSIMLIPALCLLSNPSFLRDK